tara:strand:- start:103 stop:918 length:816 start_codon:yes stop_codon:yes gene_type:complete
MKILSWNVAGIRATIRKKSLDFLEEGEYDIICFQETKAEESQVQMPEALAAMYPHRYWRSCQGIEQRKGLSGTAIWSKTKAIREINPPEVDVEGRVTALEFPTFNLVTVYTPNSQSAVSERHFFRVGVWDEHFREYVIGLKKKKATIMCGDFNVAHHDIDIHEPEQHQICAGFLEDEKIQFQNILNSGWVDSLRVLHPEKEKLYTFWNQRMPHLRKTNRGWRIDYFLVPKKWQKRIQMADILPNVTGSDHCPVILEIDTKRKLKIVETTTA